VFDFRSLKVNDLSSREPVRDLGPIVAGFFGYMIFPSEREAGFLIILILSAAIVYWGSYTKHRRKNRRRGMIAMLLAVVLYAMLPSLYKLSFEFFSPEYILLFRVLGVLALSLIFISLMKKSRLPKNSITLGVSSGIMFTIAGITTLYSIAVFGLIVTMFFLLLGPALRYAIGYFVLKETAHKREMFASFLLALLVSYTLFF
jgi:glucose uptake protein GlcU